MPAAEGFLCTHPTLANACIHVHSCICAHTNTQRNTACTHCQQQCSPLKALTPTPGATLISAFLTVYDFLLSNPSATGSDMPILGQCARGEATTSSFSPLTQSKNQ